MPSSRPDSSSHGKGRQGREARNFAQLGLDFKPSPEYNNLLRKDDNSMDHELFETLDNKISDLLEKFRALKDENGRLSEENERLQAEREGFKARVDAILGKLDGI
jgi:cell division protein ZapB